MSKKLKIKGYERRQGKLPPRDTKGRWTKPRRPKGPSVQPSLFPRK